MYYDLHPNKGVDMAMKRCNYCNTDKDISEFRKTGAKCKDCHKKDRLANRDAINASKRQQYYADPEATRLRRKNYYSQNSEKIIKDVCSKIDYTARSQKNFKRWMHVALRNSRSTDKKLGREFDIDINYVMEVLERQGFKCAITGLDLKHEYNSHYSASIDRIDSTLGHVKDNIQIVCQAVNLAKRHHSNESIKEFFEDFARLRVDEYLLSQDPDQ